MIGALRESQDPSRLAKETGNLTVREKPQDKRVSL
jgi:hypothetical protein